MLYVVASEHARLRLQRLAGKHGLKRGAGGLRLRTLDEIRADLYERMAQAA